MMSTVRRDGSPCAVAARGLISDDIRQAMQASRAPFRRHWPMCSACLVCACCQRRRRQAYLSAQSFVSLLVGLFTRLGTRTGAAWRKRPMRLGTLLLW